QQLRVRRVQVVVAVELEALDKRERGLDVTRLGQGGGPVQLYHRGAGAAAELAVQLRELRPVLRLVDVQRRDRRLQHVEAADPEGQGPVERRAANGDPVEIPERAVLIVQEHDLAVRETRLPPRV